MKRLLAAAAFVCVACNVPPQTDEPSSVEQQVVTASSGSIPTGLPARLQVGLMESSGQSWMQTSAVPWDARYMYLTTGWANNWGYTARDGSFALAYMRECDAHGRVPVFAYYQMNAEPGGGEAQFYAKAQNPTTMHAYFDDYKLLMQKVKEFGKPVMVLLEADGFAYMQIQSGNNLNAYAATAATGLAELASTPNTVAGWGQSFLQIKKSVGASNAVIGVHVSGWADSTELFYSSPTAALQPHIDAVYAFLSPMGLGANPTGTTFDVLVGDPIDRDPNYYQVVVGVNRWWDVSDTASLTSASYNRYAEWLKLWNQKAGKRWVLWQIPLGNSNQLDVCNAGGARQGYKGNFTEYFFNAANGAAHREKFASAGVIALLFGAGEPCQSSYTNDFDSTGALYTKTHAGPFLSAGGLAIPRGSGTGGGSAGAGGGSAGTGGGSAGVGGGSVVVTPVTATVQVPATVTAGSAAAITITVRAGSSALGNAIVYLQVFDASGAALSSTSFTGVNLAANASTSFTWQYPTTATTSGTFTVKSGVFGPNWTPTLQWNDTAATFKVQSGDSAAFNFEAGAQGWAAASGSIIGSVASSTTRAFAGTHALAVSFNATAAGTQQVQVAAPPFGAGRAVTFHLYIPAGSKIDWVQPFVLENTSWRWTGNWHATTAGAWTSIAVTVPTNASSLANAGIQFHVTGAYTGTAFIDAVN